MDDGRTDDVPGRGGNKMASRPRKMSAEHIIGGGDIMNSVASKVDCLLLVLTIGRLEVDE